MTGAWPGWRGFLRGTWTIARTGGGVRAVVADVVAGVRGWLSEPFGHHRHDPIECGCELTWEDAPAPVRMTYVRGPVRNRDNECQGADFSRVMTHLSDNLTEHAKRDGLSPVATAVFLSRGGHAPGTVCPSEPATVPHDQGCLLMYDDDAECTCLGPVRSP